MLSEKKNWGKEYGRKQKEVGVASWAYEEGHHAKRWRGVICCFKLEQEHSLTQKYLKLAFLMCSFRPFTPNLSKIKLNLNLDSIIQCLWLFKLLYSLSNTLEKNIILKQQNLVMYANENHNTEKWKFFFSKDFWPWNSNLAAFSYEVLGLQSVSSQPVLTRCSGLNSDPHASQVLFQLSKRLSPKRQIFWTTDVCAGWITEESVDVSRAVS